MATNRFRRIFTAPLLLVALFKKSKIDNFVGGLLVGAVISLLVNVVTSVFQEQIARQQYFEALEHEIVENYYEARGTVDSINGLRDQQEPPIFFNFTKRFHTNIWDSGNALAYIYSLDPKLQDELASYYSVGIERSNRHLDYVNEAVNELHKQTQVCRYSGAAECAGINTTYSENLVYYEGLQLAEAQYVLDRTNRLLDQFHPTKDRLNNPLLKLFMGSAAADIYVLPANYSSPKPSPAI